MRRDVGDAVKKIWGEMRQVGLGKFAGWENLDNIGWLRREKKTKKENHFRHLQQNSFS